MVTFNDKVLRTLKEKVLLREADIVIVKKHYSNTHLIIVSQENNKWEIFNGSCKFPLSKACELLGISDDNILNEAINHSFFQI